MRQLNFVQAVNEALKQEMSRDPSTFLAGEDVGVWSDPYNITSATSGLLQEFGDDRVLDTPISESAILGLAVGAAAVGLRPLVEIMFVDFLGVCLDQLFNQAAKMRYMFGGQVKLPMTVRTKCGIRKSGAAQHSQSMEAWLAHVPGLKVIMPSNPYDGKGLLISAIRDENPVVYLEHKKVYAVQGDVPEVSYTIPLGKADVKREGSDVTIVATAYMVQEALAAAESLASQGIEAEVVDPRTLVPLDLEAILNSVKKTRRLVIVHEAVKFCGFGAEISASVTEEAFDHLDAPVVRVAAPFTPVPLSPPLEQAYLPDQEKIVAAAKRVVAAKRLGVG